MKITMTSILTKIEHTRDIDVTPEDLEQWKNGPQCIQDALPHLSLDDREFLITGITPEEWNGAFNNYPEE